MESNLGRKKTETLDFLNQKFHLQQQPLLVPLLVGNMLHDIKCCNHVTMRSRHIISVHHSLIKEIFRKILCLDPDYVPSDCVTDAQNIDIPKHSR